ncbi:MAG: LysR family transcriptional regulator [Clostridiales Family XIII bacterium]|nr:LysR family transcriptional regulator [Clostridiales Family XIII bacterium]
MQIEAFLTIARYQNLSKAADAMFISQPALSKTLQRFEEGVGLRVFFRNNQGIRLTPEGEYLYSTLEPLYANIDKTIETAKRLTTAPARTLRIIESSTYDANPDFDAVKKYIRAYEEKYPDVVLIESLGDFHEIRGELEFGETDLAIMQEFGLVSLKRISYKIVSPFKLFLAMSVEHPLAVYDEPQIDRLSDEVFYRVPILGDEEDRRVTIERCERMGFRPKGIEFVPNFETLQHRLLTNRGLSICGRFTSSGAESVKYISLTGYGDKNNVVIAWRTNSLSSEAKKLVSLIPGEIIDL